MSEFIAGMMAGLAGSIDGALEEQIESDPRFEQEYPSGHVDNNHPCDNKRRVCLKANFNLKVYQDVKAQFTESRAYRHRLCEMVLEYATTKMLLDYSRVTFCFDCKSKAAFPGGLVRVETQIFVTSNALDRPDEAARERFSIIDLGPVVLEQ